MLIASQWSVPPFAPSRCLCTVFASQVWRNFFLSAFQSHILRNLFMIVNRLPLKLIHSMRPDRSLRIVFCSSKISSNVPLIFTGFPLKTLYQELLNEHLDFIHYFGDLMSNSSAELSDLLLELILTKLLSVYAYLGCSFSFSKTRNSGLSQTGDQNI